MKTDEYKAIVFEDMIKYAVQEADKELIDEITPAEEVEFTEQHQKDMEKLFKQYRSKNTKTKPKILKRVLLVAAIVILILGISILSIQALRVKFLNLILDFCDTNTELTYVNEYDKDDSYSLDDITLNYIPEGFKLFERNTIGEKIYLKFSQNEKFFELYIRIMESKANIDSEEVGVETILINGNDAYFTRKDGELKINWSDGEKTFELYGNISESELIRIAENIKSE